MHRAVAKKKFLHRKWAPPKKFWQAKNPPPPTPITFLMVRPLLTDIFPFFLKASPKVVLPDPASVVRALPGFRLSCSASGFPPIYIALKGNSEVLVNTTGTASIPLYQEGNYSCVATSNYGTERKEFSVNFTGKNLFCRENNFV